MSQILITLGEKKIIRVYHTAQEQLPAFVKLLSVLSVIQRRRQMVPQVF